MLHSLKRTYNKNNYCQKALYQVFFLCRSLVFIECQKHWTNEKLIKKTKKTKITSSRNMRWRHKIYHVHEKSYTTVLLYLATISDVTRPNLKKNHSSLI